MAQAQLVLDELKKNGVTHVVGLPDNSSARMFDLLSQDPDIQLVMVTREGEAFALAAGLWVGGKKPVVLIQNTGFTESGDSFRGTITRMRVPLVCLITYRGYAKMVQWRRESNGGVMDPETLSRPSLDSAALITEATLAAWGLPFAFLHGHEDVPALSDAFSRVDQEQYPFAILLTQDLT
jgi:sulfopyruvate decarboxylase subunit alpha